MRKKVFIVLLGLSLGLTACSGDAGKQTPNTQVSEATQNSSGGEASDKGETDSSDVTDSDVVSSVDNNEKKDSNKNNENEASEGKKMELTKNLKIRGNTNPIMTQDFGADPNVVIFDDTLYIYMTADTFETDANGEVLRNTYSKINTIHVVSTKDMKNFTDYGEIPVAGPNGIAKWAKNSWAPAAAHKVIDGKDKFFLYFADNGGGIGVLSADSPVGPFVDPLGHGLITRETPECADVLWLFDPAVMVDDDGTGYIYFGGGVPEGKAAMPGTGRCAKLGADMISIDGTPVRMETPYLFEDSGIHKYNGKYYYSYCCNFSVDKEGTAKYGIQNGEICVMSSDSPLGPFTFQERVLQNPAVLCGLSGNNHHAIFSFRDKWYITYHSRQLEKTMGIEQDYRITFINEINMKEDGTMGTIIQNLEGPDQLMLLNPYETVSAVTASQMAGTDSIFSAIPSASINGLGGVNGVKGEDFAGMNSGNMVLGKIDTGDYIELTGVDFDANGKGASEIKILANVPAGATGKVHVRLDYANRDDLCVIDLAETAADEYAEFVGKLSETVTGTHYLYLVFEGEGYTLSGWVCQ